MVDAVKAKYLCKLHMVAGTIRRDGLKRTGVYYTLTGKAGEVDSASKVRQRDLAPSVTRLHRRGLGVASPSTNCATMILGLDLMWVWWVWT